MLDLLDLLLLRRGIPNDDWTLDFRRIDGNPNSSIIYFLPWHTPYSFARHVGLTPLDFLACYEMPPAIVSSDPQLSVSAMLGLVNDAESILRQHNVRPSDATVVGLSVGTYAATYLANRLGARLCAVAPADRADLMIWQSPAARIVKRRALQRGLSLDHYTDAMRGYHPVDNLSDIRRDSLFLLGARDPFVPPSRASAMRKALDAHLPSPQIVTLETGHLKTLMSSARYQLEMHGLAPRASQWRIRLPFDTLWPSAPDLAREAEVESLQLAPVPVRVPASPCDT